MVYFRAKEKAGNMAENDFSINDAPTMKAAPISGGGGRLAAGDMILGRYAVVRELGEGGMGVVYKCLDTVGGVEVAVKGLPQEVSRNEDEMDDIRANYRLVADLRHPNIAGARTLELDETTGNYYLVMDLASGVSLKRWMKHNPQATMEAKLAILRQVAAALDYAHAEKVIHRDVKPENVMVDDDGHVKVLDFGLAAQIRSSQSRTSQAVTSRSGTWGYMSPEQWKAKPQREQADVYSFGVLAYWVFAGILPFDGDDPAVLGPAVLTQPVEPVAGLPAHMNAALRKALAKNPEDRFASCGEFVDVLEGKCKVKSGKWKALLPLALLALAAVGAWWWITHHSSPPHSPTHAPTPYKPNSSIHTPRDTPPPPKPTDTTAEERKRQDGKKASLSDCDAHVEDKPKDVFFKMMECQRTGDVDGFLACLDEGRFVSEQRDILRDPELKRRASGEMKKRIEGAVFWVAEEKINGKRAFLAVEGKDTKKNKSHLLGVPLIKKESGWKIHIEKWEDSDSSTVRKRRDEWLSGT